MFRFYFILACMYLLHNYSVIGADTSECYDNDAPRSRRNVKALTKYFLRHVVNSRDHEKNCGYDHRPIEISKYERLSLKKLLTKFNNFSCVKENNFQDEYNPASSSAYLKLKENIQLPLHFTANIQKHHLRYFDDKDPNLYTDEINYEMKRRGEIPTDDRWLLLPYSLGARVAPINVVPVAKNVSSIYISYLKKKEKDIYNFLNSNPEGRAQWTIAVYYHDDVLLFHSPSNLRPTGFCLHYELYKDKDSVKWFSEQQCYHNDCSFPHIFDRRTKLQKRQFQPKVPCTDVACPVPAGVMGIQTDSGTWESAHNVAFHYSIKGRHFVYFQNVETTEVYTRELLPGGKMGPHNIVWGTLFRNYPVYFSYCIEDRCFYFGHNRKTKIWFLQELLEDGYMGNETARGIAQSGYEFAITYDMKGVQYMFVQTGKDWFIQKLYADGTMGPKTDEGSFTYVYEIGCPINIGPRQFFYSETQPLWFVQELLEGGKMGDEVDYGYPDTVNQIAFSYLIGEDTYFFAQRGRDWFIREVLKDGHLGRTTDSGQQRNYQVAFAFKIGQVQYFYAHNINDKSWTIKYLI